jgi:hypothetical protein
MIVVLHTVNLEPINIVYLTIEAYTTLMRVGMLHLRVNGSEQHIVKVFRKEVLFADGDIMYMFICDDEELVLSLDPAFLPGQIATVNLLKERVK